MARAATSEPRPRSAIATPEKLPASVGAWKRVDGTRPVDAGSIFNYMDGAGMLRLATGGTYARVMALAMTGKVHWPNGPAPPPESGG